jgi:hypothetical protein
MKSEEGHADLFVATRDGRGINVYDFAFFQTYDVTGRSLVAFLERARLAA